MANSSTNPITRFLQSILIFFCIIWALPNTLLGCFFGIIGLCSGGKMQINGRVIEFYGGGVQWMIRRMPAAINVRALTLGHVVLAQSLEDVEFTRSHEFIHVLQYERWGPFFLFAYFGCSAWLWYQGKNPYFDNPFEIEAYQKDGMI